MEHQHLPYDIAELIFKHLKGTLLPAEQARLNAWLAEDEKNRAVLAAFSRPEALEKDIAFFDGLDIDADWDAVAVRAGYEAPHTGQRRIYLYWGAAASVLLAIGMFLLWPSPQPAATTARQPPTAVPSTPQPGGNKAMLQLANGQTVSLGQLAGDTVLTEGGSRIRGKNGQLVYDEASTEEVAYNTLRTPRGGQFHLTLADGTGVWLNASSSLRFPTRFTEKDRTVELTGEGFFEVAKDHKPFYVTVNGMKIAVLGTQFNVMGYNGITKTTLTQGAVKIQLPGKADRQLVPGQQAIVHNNNELTVIRADIDKALAWKNGLFYFKDDAMADIIAQIARWYDVEVTVKGALPTRLFSGNIRRQASLAQVLDMLHYVSGATCSVQGNTVTVQF